MSVKVDPNLDEGSGGLWPEGCQEVLSLRELHGRVPSVHAGQSLSQEVHEVHPDGAHGEDSEESGALALLLLRGLFRPDARAGRSPARP